VWIEQGRQDDHLLHVVFPFLLYRLKKDEILGLQAPQLAKDRAEQVVVSIKNDVARLIGECTGDHPANSLIGGIPGDVAGGVLPPAKREDDAIYRQGGDAQALDPGVRWPAGSA